MCKRISFLIPVICVTFLWCGCSHTSQKLRQAEQLLELSPDSALQVLRTIQPGVFSTTADKAHYALLYIRALDKCDREIASDSLIDIAIEYYSHNDSEKAGYAWFYKARCAKTRLDTKEQAEALLKAQQCAEQTANYELRGLVYGDKGVMYSAQKSYTNSIRYHKLACEAFDKAGKTNNSTLALVNTADDFLRLAENDSALAYYEKAAVLSFEQHDTLLLSTVYRNEGTIHLMQKEYLDAIAVYSSAPLTGIASYDSNKWLLLAIAYDKAGLPQLAKECLKKISYLGEMGPSYYELLQHMSERNHEYKQALHYAQAAKYATDSLYEHRLNVSFAGMDKKYNYQQLQLDNSKLVIKDKQRNILLLVVLVVLSAGAIVTLIRRNNQKNQQLKAQKKIIEQSRELVKRDKENYALLETQLRLREVLLQSVENYRRQAIKRPADLGLGSVTDSIPTFLEEVLACMDAQYNNISKRLPERYNSLSEKDVVLCCLVLAGFETGMIATILDVKNDSIRIQRSRIRRKMNLHNSVSFVRFLRRI